ncbi:MAG: peptidoglycan-binding domain-containing protein [Pseudolabrys sp.]
MRRRIHREAFDEVGSAGRLAAAISRHPREFVGILMVSTATVAIVVNAVFLQIGPHPAPIFTARPQPKFEIPIAAPRPVALQPNAAPEATPQNRPQLIADIQRELNRRGFYDGAVDGIWGARTDAATRDFVQAAGIKTNPEASDALLRAVMASNMKQNVRAAAAEPVRNDPIAELIAPTKRVLAIQRALADFGYGQIKSSGNFDPETRAAIEKFERDRRLPVTGQISDRFVRELAAMTGRPLE